MLNFDQVQHVKAAIGLGVTSVAIPAAWIPAPWMGTIDFSLRIFLTLIGIATGIYSMLYYRKKYKEGK